MWQNIKRLKKKNQMPSIVYIPNSTCKMKKKSCKKKRKKLWEFVFKNKIELLLKGIYSE